MTKPRLLAVCVLSIVTFATSSAVWAQGGTTGTLLGTVIDQTGNPIKGVKISARSDTQIGGAKVTYTNSEGGFRLVGLLPGIFEVTATAPKLKSVIQKEVRISVTSEASIDMMMEVETGVEEVKVVERAPVVSTTNAAVRESFDEEFIDNLPSDFKLGAEAVIANSVPGAVQASTRTARIRGGGSNQTAFQVEGFDMINQRSTLKGMASIEVSTAGYGAENATVAGGVVNMVTKSGSNKFEIDLNGFAEDNHLQFFLDSGDSRDRSFFYVVNPNISGPIIKDKLWFFVNFEGRREQYVDIEDPLGLQPRNPDRRYGSLRGSGKLTWQVTPRNKLVSFNNFNFRYNMNQIRGYAPAAEPEAQQRMDDEDWFTGLIWESLLTDSVFFKSQAGLQRFFGQVGPQQCQTNPDCDNIPQIRETVPREIWFQNFNSRTQTITNKFQFVNLLEFFPHTKSLGEHDIKIKNDFATETIESASSVPGDRRITLAQGAPSQQVEYFANDPRFEDARYGWFIRAATSWKNVTSVSDTWRMTRYFTLTPGVAFTKARAFNNIGDTAFDANAITPHIAVAWDATHDGRTVIRASFNNYLDVQSTALAQFTAGSQVSRTCRWDATSQTYSSGCTFAGGVPGRTVGSPCGPDGVDLNGKECLTALKIPRTWEYTFGAEREIISGVSLAGDFVYRLYTNPFEQLETNRIWNASGSELDPNGSFRNGRATTVTDLETPSDAKRQYLGTTIAVHKREGKLKTSVGYTLSYLRGNVLDGNANAFGDIAARDVFLYGYLPDDSRHNVRGVLTYQWTKFLSTGLIYDYKSGRPYLRRFRNAITGGFDDYRASAGINPGSNINDPGDDRQLRLPDQQIVSLQSRLNWKFLLKVNFETYVDVINLLAQRTTIGVQQNDGIDFGTQTDRQGPFRLRIGARYRW
jgi:hypothetical protein